MFVHVVNEIAAIEADTKIANQITANGWSQLEVDGEAVAGVYYRNHTKQDTEKDYIVFENFSILGSVDNDTLADYANKTVKVTAYAIQKDGIDSAAKAWELGNKAAEQGGWIEVPETNGEGDEGTNP